MNENKQISPSELLARYARGERTFSNANLSGARRAPRESERRMEKLDTRVSELVAWLRQRAGGPGKMVIELREGRSLTLYTDRDEYAEAIGNGEAAISPLELQAIWRGADAGLPVAGDAVAMLKQQLPGCRIVRIREPAKGREQMALC
jgi:hypothetical protein